MISVIVPTYQVENYLKECIESILKQTFQDFELILVDDGSFDHCSCICDDYAIRDNRIKVIHKLNAGQSDARNYGIELSDGSFLCFIDSDDLIQENYLLVLFELLNKENADVSVCESYVFEKKEDIPLNNHIETDAHQLTGKQACKMIYDLPQSMSDTVWAKLFRRELFELIRFPFGIIYEDHAIVPQVLYSAQTVIVNKTPLYFYRKRPNSTMNRPFSIQRFNVIDAIELCIEYYKQNSAIEMVELAKKTKQIFIAQNNLYSYATNMQKNVPKQYKMSKWKATVSLKRNLPNEFFSSRLINYYPKMVVFNEYLIKIHSMIHEKRILK